MTARAKKSLKFAAAAIFAAFLVAITVNAAVDYWMPQAGLKEPAMPSVTPPVDPAALQMPTTQPLPAAPLPEQDAAIPAEPQWNQPLFEPKFDGPGWTTPGGTRSGGTQGFATPDFSKVLNQFAPQSQVLPPSIEAPGSNPMPLSVRPIFGSKSGGTEGGALDAAGGLPGAATGAVNGAVSSPTSLLNKR
ncbi:MAG TPA: hypothetical protein VKT73_08245 [Xanthobacteraceae bacterium]|nr:hypothetical protein [Xanthobacteraceae bacterium]